MPEQPQYSPFEQSEAAGISLIVQMRIYDVLLAMYTETHPEGAAALYELHSSGGLMGSLPYFNPDSIETEEDLPPNP